MGKYEDHSARNSNNTVPYRQKVITKHHQLNQQQSQQLQQQQPLSNTLGVIGSSQASSTSGLLLQHQQLLHQQHLQQQQQQQMQQQQQQQHNQLLLQTNPTTMNLLHNNVLASALTSSNNHLLLGHRSQLPSTAANSASQVLSSSSSTHSQSNTSSKHNNKIILKKLRQRHQQTNFLDETHHAKDSPIGQYRMNPMQLPITQPSSSTASNASSATTVSSTSSIPNSSRLPLNEISNALSSSSKRLVDSCLKGTPKQTRFFTQMTFLGKDATKKFKVCLYVDKELGIPQEYATKLQDHAIDNDVATDEEQINSAIRKLRGALEEEVYMQREIEQELLDHIMFNEIERWDSEELVRKEQERVQTLLDFELLRKNLKIAEKKKHTLDELSERVFMRYQVSCLRPFTIASHERLLFKTIDKLIPKYKDAFKNNAPSYKQYLSKKVQTAAVAAANQRAAAVAALQAERMHKSNNNNNNTAAVAAGGLNVSRISSPAPKRHAPTQQQIKQAILKQQSKRASPPKYPAYEILSDISPVSDRKNNMINNNNPIIELSDHFMSEEDVPQQQKLAQQPQQPQLHAVGHVSQFRHRNLIVPPPQQQQQQQMQLQQQPLLQPPPPMHHQQQLSNNNNFHHHHHSHNHHHHSSHMQSQLQQQQQQQQQSHYGMNNNNNNNNQLQLMQHSHHHNAQQQSYHSHNLLNTHHNTSHISRRHLHPNANVPVVDITDDSFINTVPELSYV